MEANQALLKSLEQLAIAIAVAAIAVVASLVAKLLAVRLRGRAGS
jgi:hypothetical protein